MNRTPSYQTVKAKRYAVQAWVYAQGLRWASLKPAKLDSGALETAGRIKPSRPR